MRSAILATFRRWCGICGPRLWTAWTTSRLAGDSGADEDSADLAGLFGLSGVGEEGITQAQKLKGPGTLGHFLALVNGTHATSLADLNVVLTVGANTLFGSTVSNATASNETVAQFLQRSGVTWMVRGDLETAHSAGKYAGAVSLRRGLAGAGQAALWRGAELISDPFSGGPAGQVRLTVNYFFDVAYPRPASFKVLKFVS